MESLKPASQTEGRFGWKARYPTLTDAVAAALAGEMGLTTSRFPGAEAGGDAPEVTDLELAALVAFVRALAPPPPSDLRHPGAQVFARVGCTQCHSMTPVGPDNVAVRPFSDLQVHDLGPALADGIQEGAATGRQFRTAPLWGLRFVTQGYLHDGRAASLDDAIAAHAGAADDAARRYQTLAPSHRAALLNFLQGL